MESKQAEPMLKILWEYVWPPHTDTSVVPANELLDPCPTLHAGLFHGLVYALSMWGSSHHRSYQPAESKVSG